MSGRPRLARQHGRWVASCPACPWTYSSAELSIAHTEAWYHTCTPILGPRPPARGTKLAAATGTFIRADDSRPLSSWWWSAARRPEVW